MRKHLLFYYLLVFLGIASCDEKGTALLRPVRATLKHDEDQQFVGHDGIKKLCETHLGMKYLMRPEIRLEALKNRTKNDLVDPKVYEQDELQFSAKVSDSYLADIYVKFIDDELGYGMFANKDIKSGELIGEYTGVIDSSDNVHDHSWSWSFPSNIYKPELNIPEVSVDSKFSGNALRFVNHSDSPNSEMRRIFLDGIVRTLYIANKDIARDAQIFVSYGSAYWSHRKKRDV
jgi:hypothetical protein